MDPLSEDDITIGTFRSRFTKGNAGYRVYYYQGNIFIPLETPGADAGKIRGAISRWLEDPKNAARVKRDRAHPDYRTLMELADVPPPT